MIRSSHNIEIPATLAEWCDPERTALIVYDMQVGICRQIPGASEIIKRSAIVLDAARTARMRVAFTRHFSLPSRWMGATQLRTAMAWQRHQDPDAIEPWFLPGAEATKIVPELAPLPDEAVFDKLTMSIFDSTAVKFALYDCGIRAIAIVGIAMEIGIEPTVRQATDNGLAAVLVEDACGFGNQAARDRAIATLKFIGETVVTDAAGFCSAVRRSGAQA
jgi:biuret amidohydrolase